MENFLFCAVYAALRVARKKTHKTFSRGKQLPVNSRSPKYKIQLFNLEYYYY